MKNRIIDWLFYSFPTNLFDEYFEIDIYLKDKDNNWEKQTKMLFIPPVGSFIRFENGDFEVKKVVSAMYGRVLWIDGAFTKTID